MQELNAQDQQHQSRIPIEGEPTPRQTLKQKQTNIGSEGEEQSEVDRRCESVPTEDNSAGWRVEVEWSEDKEHGGRNWHSEQENKEHRK